MEQTTGYQIKKLPFEEGSFMANGKKYFVRTRWSNQRWALLQKLQSEASFGVTFEDMLRNWEKVNNYANRGAFTDIAVLAYNTVHGIKNIVEREPVLMRMCALFLNREDEDERYITEDLITDKIKDWEIEGYDVNDFFALAVNTIRGFIVNYKRVTQNISELEEVTGVKKAQN